MKKKPGENPLSPEKFEAQPILEPLSIQEELEALPVDPFLALMNTSSKALDNNTSGSGTMLDARLSGAHTMPQKNAISSIKSKTLSEDERYEVIKRLGEGGMGLVELVKDHLLGREIARKTIKSLKGDVQSLNTRQKIFLWRLRREAEITAILEHPNIIPLYEMQQKNTGEIQFTMRKVEGEDLRAILKKMDANQIPYDENLLLSIFRKVCDAVSYAHSKGVVHRDLKPENIMVGQFGEVYVMDWGIAKQLKQQDKDDWVDFQELSINTEQESEYRTQGGMGTQGYMSPEQCENASQVTPQGDVYALGKILKECFTLQSPQETLKQQLDLMKKELKQKRGNAPKNKWEEIERLPSEITAIVQKASEEQLTNRYASVQALIEDLERYQKNQRILAKDYSGLELFLKWAKRNKQKLLVGCLLLGMSVGVRTYVQWQNQSEKEALYQKILTQHRNRLNEIINEFTQAKQSEEETKDAIYEISKMQEPEILEQLLTLVHQGTQIFQKGHPDKIEIAFYFMMVEAIGRLENPEAGKAIIEAMQLLMKKIQKESSVSEIDTHFMVQLAYALKNAKAFDQGKAFYLIRSEMELQSHKSNFSERTKRVIGFFASGALETLNEEIRSQPTNETLYYHRGQIKFVLRDYPGSMNDFSESIRLNPQFISAYSSRATVKRFLNNPQGAIADFTEAIHINPKLGFLYNNRGIIKDALGQTKEALEDYSQAIRLDPQWALAYNNRGSLKHRINDSQGAIADYTEAIRLNPQYTDAFYNRGLVKHFLKDFLGAIADYTEAIRLNPQNSEVYNDRGLVKKELGDQKGAIEDYTQSILLRPHNWKPYTNRGDVWRLLNRYEKAIEDYSEAIRMNPLYKDAYLNRGVCRFNLKQPKQAIEDYNETIRLDPQYALAYFNRGLAYQESFRDIPSAKANFQKFLELTQNTKDSHLQNLQKEVLKGYPELESK